MWWLFRAGTQDLPGDELVLSLTSWGTWNLPLSLTSWVTSGLLVDLSRLLFPCLPNRIMLMPALVVGCVFQWATNAFKVPNTVPGTQWTLHKCWLLVLFPHIEPSALGRFIFSLPLQSLIIFSLLQLCFCYSYHLRNAFSASLQPADVLSSKSEVLHLHEPDLIILIHRVFSFCGFPVRTISSIYHGSQSYTVLSSVLFSCFQNKTQEFHQITCPLNSHIFLRIEHASMSWTFFFFNDFVLFIINCMYLQMKTIFY